MNGLQRLVSKIFGIPTQETAIVRRGYDGAKRYGAAVSGWQASGTSADSELWQNFQLLRARAWDIYRNDANVNGAVENIVSQVVDKGLLVRPKVKMRRGTGLATGLNQEIQSKFEEWAANKGWCDPGARNTFYKMQKTVLRSLLVSGEVLVRIVKQPFSDSPCPFALEIIEADQLDDRLSFRTHGGNEVRMGVEVDQWRRPVAYWILPYHPGDIGILNRNQYNAERVPASEILHIWNWRGIRPGQTRGVTALAPVIIESRNLYGYKESEQVKARIQSCIMGTYETDTPDNEPLPEDEDGFFYEEMEPGVIKKLPPGMKFTGFDPSSPNPNFVDFMRAGYRAIAQGLGVASFTVTGDLSDANYSSMRTGMLQQRKNFEQLRDDLIEDFISPAYIQWMDRAVLSGYLSLPSDYELNKSAYRLHDVNGSPWGWVDPLKDIQAAKTALEMRVTSRTRLLAEQGIDIEEIDAELAAEIESAKKHGLIKEEETASNANPVTGLPETGTNPPPDEPPAQIMEGLTPTRSLSVEEIEGMVSQAIASVVPEAVSRAVVTEVLPPEPVSKSNNELNTEDDDDDMPTIININIGSNVLPEAVALDRGVSTPPVLQRWQEPPEDVTPLPFIYAGLTPVSHPFGRAKNCVKGMVCGNSCISKSKKCSNGLSPAQKPAAKKATTKTAKTPKTPKAPKATAPASPAATSAPSATTAPTATPAAPVVVTTNDKNLKAVRDSLVKKHGQKLVDDAEQNMSKLLNSKDNAIFIAVPNSEVLGFVVGDRFKNPFELASDKYDKGYYNKRKKVEEEVVGVPVSASDGDRPIYGYMGTTKDVTKGGHAETHEGYGSIAVQLKQDVKDRATFTGSDSFKSGVASKVSDPNAASLVHHFKAGQKSQLQSDSMDKSFLKQAATAKSIEDLQLNVHGRQYVETQIRGQVKPSDIEALHFRPKGALDTPSKEVAEWAKANNVPIFVNGKKADLDSIINRPEQTPEIKELRRELNAVLNNKDDAFSRKQAPVYDFAKIESIAKKMDKQSKKLKMADGEADDKVLKQLIQSSGYDGKPEVLKSKEFSSFVKDNDGTILVRSVNDAGKVTGKQIQDQLKTGDNFIGNGVYGNGTYATHTGDADGVAFKLGSGTDADRKNQLKQSRGYGNESVVMSLRKEANILLNKDGAEHVKQIEKELDKWKKSLIKDEIAKNPPPKLDPAVIAKAKPIADNFEQNVIQKTAVTKTPGVKTWMDSQIEIKHADGKVEYVGDAMFAKNASVTPVALFKPNFKDSAFEYTDRHGAIIQFKFTDPHKVDWDSKEGKAFVAKVAQDRAVIRAKDNKIKGVDEWETINDGGVAGHRQSITKQVEGRVKLVRDTLIGDSKGNSSARLAAIMGYDAIAAGRSGQKYLNVINRTALVIRAENLPSSTVAANKDIVSIGK